jgi:hypothetical protein
MNCDELAATLETTLLHQRDPRWFREARGHAERCPACARLLELHRIEERLAELPAVEPGGDFLETVMNRVTQREPRAVRSARGAWYEALKHAILFVGALTLAVAYVVPPAGESWLSNLWPAVGLVRRLGISVYLTQHPPAAIVLAGLAALLIVLGLALPERPVPVSGDHGM